MIEAQAQSITQDYSKRFRSSGAQTARQAAGQTAGALAGGFGPAGAALGTAISSGIEVGLGVVKFSEAADDFEPNLIESIGNVAAGTPTTAELMRLHLARHSDSLISTQADAIMAQLGTTSFIVAGEINYANCEQIGDLPLGAFESFGLQLYKDCMRVRKLMSREAQTDVYAQLQENLAQRLFASLQDILKMDIASPLSSVAASAAAGMVTSTIQKHLEEAKVRILAESKRRELATDEYQTSDTRKPKRPSSKAQDEAKPSGKSSAKPKPETLNFAPMRNKAKASSRPNNQPEPEKKTSYKQFKDSVLSRSELEATKLYFESGRASASDKASFDDYLKAKYAHYKNGQSIGSIVASSIGFELHRLSSDWQELASEYKWLGKSTEGVGKGIDKLHDILIKPVMGLLGDAAVIGGHTLHDTVGATKCLLSSGCNLRTQAHAEIDPALATVFAPIARAIDEWKNDLTPPQREVMMPLLDRAGKAFDISGAAAVGKAVAASAVRTVLPASARTLEAVVAKTAHLGAQAARTPIARAAVKALDRAADTLKASTAAVKAECASVARNLDDLAAGMPNPTFASAGHASGISSLDAAARYRATVHANRPTIPPAVAKPTVLTHMADDTITKPSAGQTAGKPSVAAPKESSTLPTSDASKATFYMPTKTELAPLSVDIQQFGPIVTEIAKYPEVKSALSRWGTGRDGTNQLLKHTLGKELLDPSRMPALELKAGLKPGTLTDVHSKDPIKVSSALKAFDNLAIRIKSNPTFKVNHGTKEGFYLQAGADAEKGIGIIQYNSKLQSIMNTDAETFRDMFKA